MTRAGFEGILGNAFAAFGFPAEGPMGYVFPTEMFLAGSDLSPITDHWDEFISGLLTWEPSPDAYGPQEEKTIPVTVTDPAEFYPAVNSLFARNLWTDAMPIVPPTEELVNWILTGTEMSPDEQILPGGLVQPRGSKATVRALAICMAMAGGRPEYMPFFIAGVQGMINPDSKMQTWNSSTHSTFPACVVNGPAAKDIRMSSGYGCLGPDPQRPANTVIGRAVRLLQINLGGAMPSTGTMAIYGGMRATNAFFWEDEERSPWTTWAEDRGWRRDQNVVTMTVCNSMINSLWTFGDEHYNNCSLLALADVMAIPNRSRYSQVTQYKLDNENLMSGIVLLPIGFVKSIIEVNGYTKEDVKNILWENSKVPFEKIEKWDYVKSVTQHEVHKDAQANRDPIPVCPKASQLTVVVAGGTQSGHGYYMGPVTQGSVQSYEVKLPSNWDKLIQDAVEDLGPVPPVN